MCVFASFQQTWGKQNEGKCDDAALGAREPETPAAKEERFLYHTRWDEHPSNLKIAAQGLGLLVTSGGSSQVWPFGRMWLSSKAWFWWLRCVGLELV